MKIEIKVPAMGESISEATIGTLLKPNGTAVKVDDELLELETDKVNQVLYAQQAGTVNWNVSPGDTVKISQVIGLIDNSAQSSEKEKAPTEKKTKKEASQEKETSAPKQEAQTVAPESQPQQAKKPTEKPTEDKPTENKVKTLSVGAETKARSTKEDFIAEIHSSSETAPKQTSSTVTAAPSTKSVTKESSSEKNETRKPLSKVRKVIASRLVEVLQQTAMLTTFNEVDMTHIMSLRDVYKDAFTKKYNTKLGFMPFFVKASVSALKAFPEVNAYIDGDDLVYRNYFDIGIAVGTDKGLFVPVIRNCEQLSFAEIEQSIDTYANKAKEGGLALGDLQGGGFTITNGGTYGSLLSTPILNPPQSAILGMHKIMKRPVVVNDQIVIRQMMYLALSYDHRVIDGKEAVSFLVHIKNTLEDPSRLLIGI